MLKHIGKMTVAAHRGDCYNYYENTMTAFEKSIDEGAHMIETDVRLSKDGVLVLMHDETVDRTTDSTGYIKDKEYKELCEINAGDTDCFEAIPEFEALMRLCSKNDVMVNIEIKEYYSEENKERCIKCIEDSIALVEKYNMTDKVIINSFDAWVLEYVYKKYDKKYMLHGFYPYSIMKNVNMNPDEYLYCACIYEETKKEVYDYLKARNIEAWIGPAVTQASKLGIAIRLGAKLITTNNPTDVLKKLKNI